MERDDVVARKQIEDAIGAAIVGGRAGGIAGIGAERDFVADVTPRQHAHARADHRLPVFVDDVSGNHRASDEIE